MKKMLSPPQENCSSLFRHSQDALRWEVFRTALELGIFDHLEEPVNAETLATKLKTHAGNTELFLNALTAMGYVVKSGGFFQNGSLAKTFLLSRGDTSLISSILFMSSWHTALLGGGLKKLLQEGPPTPMEMRDETLWAQAARKVMNHSRCGRAQELARRISLLPEFPGFSKMLDLGCGPGIIGLAVTARHPSLECVFFDRPGICEVIREVVAEYGMENRTEIREGDFEKDLLGEDYDCIMANFCLGMTGEDTLRKIFEKAHSALTPSGMLIITTAFFTDEDTAPEPSLFGWLAPLMQGSRFLLHREIFERALLRAGFRSVSFEIIDTLDQKVHGPITMIRARKGEPL